MRARDFLRQNICYAYGDNFSAYYATRSHRDLFEYPASLAELAEDCGFKHYTHADGRGMTLNFDHITGLHTASLYPQMSDSSYVYVGVYMPTFNMNDAANIGLQPRTIFDEPFMEEGTGVVFRDRYLLFVDLERDIVEDMRYSTFDFRSRQSRSGLAIPPHLTL